MTSAAVVAIPWQRCLWHVSTQSRGISDEALRYQFEDVVPMTTDELLIAWARQGDQAVLCGIQPHHLRHWLQDQAIDDVWAVVPDGLPPFVGKHGFDEDLVWQLDLAIGPAEPRLRRRWRRGLVLAHLAAALLIALIAAAGVWQRSNAWQQRTETARQAAHTQLLELFPATAPSPATLNAALIMAERRLDRQGQQAPIANVALPVQAALARWPENVEVRVGTLTAGSERMQLRGHAENPADIETLHSSLDQWQAADRRWQIQPLLLTRQRDRVGFTLTWSPEEDRP